jgi:hypothetical protein
MPTEKFPQLCGAIHFAFKTERVEISAQSLVANGALLRAIDFPTCLHADAHNPAVAIGTDKSQRLYCTIERIELISVAIFGYLKCSV